jgi:predicted SnoaL-like aldol condensation-catalyzing enzyme
MSARHRDSCGQNIQHNPDVPTGLKGFMEFFRARFAQPLPPDYKRELLNLIGENDMVVVYVLCRSLMARDSLLSPAREVDLA